MPYEILEWIDIALNAAVMSAMLGYETAKFRKKVLTEKYRHEFGFYPAPHLTSAEIYAAIDRHERRLKPKPVY